MDKKQREIKFRAWNLNQRCMRQVAEINFLWKPTSQASPLGGTVVVWDHPDAETAMIKGHTEKWLFSDIILMEYIEQKDKNGVEIYEGDIIKVFPFADNKCVAYMGYKPVDPGEIIGNIWKNPELMLNNGGN